MPSTGPNTKGFGDKSDSTSRSSYMEAFCNSSSSTKKKKKTSLKSRPCEWAAYRYNPEGNFILGGKEINL